MHLRTPLLLIALLLLVGCVDATIVVNVNPDGSGSFDVDIGYDQRSWPSFFGDPFSGWSRKSQLANFSDPGLGPWAEPAVVKVGGFRRFRTEVFFADIDQVQILGWDDGRSFRALGFQYDREQSAIRMTVGVMPELAKPLPLPTPTQAGMDVSISEALLTAIRAEIRPVIEGAELRLIARVPGQVERADAFDSWQGREARIVADADRIALAMRERAGQLMNEATLNDGVLEVRWTGDASSAAELEEYQLRLAAAKRWWGDGGGG